MEVNNNGIGYNISDCINRLGSQWFLILSLLSVGQPSKDVVIYRFGDLRTLVKYESKMCGFIFFIYYHYKTDQDTVYCNQSVL